MSFQKEAKHDGFFHLGTITRTHGVKGNVIIQLDVDEPAAYRKLKAAFLLTGGKPEPYKIVSSSVSGDHLNVHFEGIDDLDAAEKLVKTTVMLPIDQLPGLKGKRIYFHEAVGMQVIDKQEGLLGVIQKIYDLPEQPVAAVEFNGKELLFPLISKFIDRIDRENRIIHVNLPDGLVSVYR